MVENMTAEQYQKLIAELAKQVDNVKLLNRVYISLLLAVEEKESD